MEGFEPLKWEDHEIVVQNPPGRECLARPGGMQELRLVTAALSTIPSMQACLSSPSAETVGKFGGPFERPRPQ